MRSPTSGSAVPNQPLDAVRSSRAAGWLSPAEAAALLGTMFGRSISVRTVQSWCHRRRDPLPHVVLGARILIHQEEVLRWVGRGGAAVAPGLMSEPAGA